MPRMTRADTRERILAAFLAVAAETGLARTTTRAVADHAAVNEVTLFRHFGDKSSLTKEAVRYLLARPAPARPDRRPVAGGPGLQRLVELMKRNRDTLNNRDLLQLGIVETFSDTELSALIKSGPLHVQALYRSALAEAGDEVRPDIDQEAAALSLQGLVFMTVFWQQRGFSEFEEARWDSVLEAAARAFFKGDGI
jgi:AcrR family transcriptional regulator